MAQPDLLSRARLVGRLNQAAEAPMVLVTGIAGSGKTSLARQWLDALAEPAAVAWMTVDARDNDELRFWRYLSAALALARPDLTWSAEDGTDADRIEELAGALAGPDRVVVVLDDLHYLVDETVLAQLDHFAYALPDNVRLVLVSRARPELRLARRALTGRLAEIDNDELMFTAAETAEVMAAADAGPVHEVTGGWPIAVSLSRHVPEADTSGRRAGRQMTAFLTEEVLSAMPAELQRFLEDTSVVDELSVGVANALRDADDSARWLDDLIRYEGLLIPLDGGADSAESVWYYHAIVRDHLRRRLEDHDPRRFAALQRRAAMYYEAVSLDTAVDYALAADDPDYAADLIARVVAQDDRRVEVSRRLAWLEALPATTVGGRPDLRDYAPFMAWIGDRRDLVALWLQARAGEGQDELSRLTGAAWEAVLWGDLGRMRELSLAALELCPQASPIWFPLMQSLLSAETARGDWAAANGVAQRLRVPAHLCGPGVWQMQEGVRAVIAMTAARLGDDGQARAALDEFEEWMAQARAAGYTSRPIHGDRAHAVVAFYAGDVAAAAEWTELPSRNEIAGRSFYRLGALLDQIRIRRAVGDLDAARRLVVEAQELLSELADPQLYAVWVADEVAALADGDGRPVPRPAAPVPPVLPSQAAHRPMRLSDGTLVEPLSEREVEVLRMLRSEFSLPEIARHLYISHNTAKTHARTIYRKLNVSRRSAAVARARELKYL